MSKRAFDLSRSAVSRVRLYNYIINCHDCFVAVFPYYQEHERTWSERKREKKVKEKERKRVNDEEGTIVVGASRITPTLSR